MKVLIHTKQYDVLYEYKQSVNKLNHVTHINLAGANICYI